MAEVDNLNFIGKNNDFIMDIMLYNQRTYSYNELEIFFDLSHKYYDVDDNGYFFDCGCNILTSAIYALSKKRNLKAVAFEPIKETFKFARINCILNNMEDRTTLINTALSNINTPLLMECSEGDYRRSSVVFSGEGLSNIDSYESVNAVTLDDWCETTNFDVDKINYIWIDVEGYEGYLIDGAINILKKKKIPLYLEFVSDFLKKTGSYDLLIKNLSELYSYFIVVTHSSNEKTFDYELKPISELNNLGDSCDCNLFMVP